MTARQTLGGLALPLVIGLLAFSGTAPAKEHWATYLNPRFGAAADYPADLFTVKDAPPENGDGQTFHTADGRAELAIYGGYHIRCEPPEAYGSHNSNPSDVASKKIRACFYPA